jgi:hypothetical protein
VRRAVLRAQRRGGMAAVVQRSNRRGAFFHRIDGASSQAVERGPTPQAVRPQATYGLPRCKRFAEMDVTVCVNVFGLDIKCPAKMEIRTLGSC